MKIDNFFSELKRRNVIRAAIRASKKSSPRSRLETHNSEQ
jgi:hypothetical protein